DSAVRTYRDSARRDTANTADSIARVIPGAPVIPRAAAPAPRPADTAAARARRDTTRGARP
ncbi:MAG TPA: hypothetical protein VF488_08080, partial [Gemmatimonadaceae bacterium]